MTVEEFAIASAVGYWEGVFALLAVATSVGLVIRAFAYFRYARRAYQVARQASLTPAQGETP